VGLVTKGMLRERVRLSVLGSAGLLINVPWIILWYFPGEGRVPLLTLVSEALILATAVLLTRGNAGGTTALAACAGLVTPKAAESA
jgi:hypothetical protein